VRGFDLLDNTPRQWLLQAALSLPHPQTLHLPLLVEASGEKLSKSRRSLSPALGDASSVLRDLLGFLGLEVPKALIGAPPPELLAWAVPRWDPSQIPHQQTIAVPEAL
jgi:glutamyl-Q tRNA(Asp) synthetase